jgi:hypothetical protein
MSPSVKQLPAVSTGYKHFDLLWSQLIPDAASYVAILPREADCAWATAEGLRFVGTSLLKRWSASDELARTPSHSTLRRVRARHLQLLERQYDGQALTLVAALVDQARVSKSFGSPTVDRSPRWLQGAVGPGVSARKHWSERGQGAEMTTWLQVFSYASTANGADNRQGPLPGVVLESR